MLLVIIVVAVLIFTSGSAPAKDNPTPVYAGIEWPWEAPDTSTIPNNEEGDLIRYGREILTHTAVYFGPLGKVAKVSNGMSCQNCHLESGTKQWGNNYGAVSSMYPKFRRRSGTVESIEKKINDCFERSMNGSIIDSNGREMKAMIAYMHWLGKDVNKGKVPLGTGLAPLPYLDRAADTVRGKVVFVQKCALCHGATGQGLTDTLTGIGYTYPPLWGEHSYNTGAGIYRVGKFASYVKDNMPFGASHIQTQLTDAEAWDVAAYVNSRPRTHMEFKEDWPDLSLKPVDHPFGPYTDTFSEQQHKYGPFKPIEKARNAK